MTEVNVGSHLIHRELVTIQGEPVQIPDPERLVHLQFRRYAGCPICNVHLRSITQRHEGILAAGIREVVVFHSSAETMLEFQSELPFAAIRRPRQEALRRIRRRILAQGRPEPARPAGRRSRQERRTQRAGRDGHRRKAPRAPCRLPDRARRPGPRGEVRKARQRPVVGRRTTQARAIPQPTPSDARKDANPSSDASVSKEAPQRQCHARASILEHRGAGPGAHRAALISADGTATAAAPRRAARAIRAGSLPDRCASPGL